MLAWRDVSTGRCKHGETEEYLRQYNVGHRDLFAPVSQKFLQISAEVLVHLQYRGNPPKYYLTVGTG